MDHVRAWLSTACALLPAIEPSRMRSSVAQGHTAKPCMHVAQLTLSECRFMKLRLDRVLKVELGQIPKAEALSSTGNLPDYETLDKDSWTAPYLPYRPGWWKVFMPDASNGASQH